MRRLCITVVALAACGSPKTTTPKPATVTVAITSPTPGAELLASDQPMITVTGTVTTSDANVGVLGAWVNGTLVSLDSSGAFTAQVAPSVGVNHIVVDAGDGFGTFATQQLDVMWAPDYLSPNANATGFTVPDALALYLGQRFFDGRLLGTTLDLTADPVIAHDLAASLELILWDIDLASLLSGGLHVQTGSSQLNINIPSATPAEIIVDAQVVTTSGPAVDLTIDLNGVFLATTGTFVTGGKTMQVAGGISADMHASAHVVLGVGADGSIAVSVTNTTAVVGPLEPSFTGPDGNTLDGFITVGNNDFRTLIQNIIQAQLIPTFTSKIPPLLATLLGATDKLLKNVTFTLDAMLGGTPVNVTINSTIGGLDVAAGPPIGVSPGHVTVPQVVQIATASTPIHASTRGAARIGAPPIVPPTDTAALDVLLSQDFLNALLHSLWNSGLLEGQTTVGGLTAMVSAKLAPVAIPVPDASPCAIDGVRCDLVLQLGQVELTLPDFQQSFAINASAGARVVVSGTTISFVIEQAPTLVVWETSAVPGRLSPDAVTEIVANVVWPQLFGAIGDKLHVTLPIPDLAALGLDALSPKLANAQLQLDVHDQAAITAGFIGLGADLSLSAPHP
jgi:hypothetical protein